MAIKIVTDSTAYLSEEQINKYDIKAARLMVNFGEESFKEGTTYSNSEYYNKLRNSKLTASTSQPSTGDFFSIYEQIAAEGDEILSIHISSVLSGTVASAENASALLPDAKITIFDSRSTAATLGWMVLFAAEAAQKGYSSEEIISKLEEIKANTNLLFLVDTLEYLKRGGRIGGAQALFGSLLKIKPILHLKDGRIEVFDKVRTKQKALTRLKNELYYYLEKENSANLKVAMLSIDAQENAQELRDEILSQYPDLSVDVSEVGPVIGTHAGPGTVGVAFGIIPSLDGNN